MSHKIANFGSVSSGTMRVDDLIPTFCQELRNLGHRSKKLTEIERHSTLEYFESEQAMFDLDDLFNMLEEHAPAWGYFGSHPGDGSDYGFWVSEGIEYDFDGLKVDDLSEVPSNYVGEILHVNDHGNMTLYVRFGNNHLKEVWSLV